MLLEIIGYHMMAWVWFLSEVKWFSALRSLILVFKISNFSYDGSLVCFLCSHTMLKYKLVKEEWYNKQINVDEEIIVKTSKGMFITYIVPLNVMFHVTSNERYFHRSVTQLTSSLIQDFIKWLMAIQILAR